MSTQDIVQKLWNLCNVLRDDGITYHQYVTELTYILFLKMADETGDRTTSNYAARLCMELRYKNEDGTVFDDWFLPSRDELNLMYKNLYKNKVDSFCNGSDYWSSSEDSADVAWTQDFSSDYLSSYSRNYALRVRPIRAF